MVLGRVVRCSTTTGSDHDEDIRMRMRKMTLRVAGWAPRGELRSLRYKTTRLPHPIPILLPMVKSFPTSEITDTKQRIDLKTPIKTSSLVLAAARVCRPCLKSLSSSY